jgi:spore coat protein U-like protein
MNKSTSSLISLALFSWLAHLPSAQAATTTDTFLVSANVSATCSVTANDLTFVDYAGNDLTAASTLSVTCTNTTGYNVGMNQGLHGTSVTDRKMQIAAGAETLNYGLYRDAARTQNWGETVGTDTVAGTGTGSAQSIDVYGKIPAGQNPPIGNYSDSITVTLTY